MPEFGVVRKKTAECIRRLPYGGGWARGGDRGLPPRLPPAAAPATILAGSPKFPASPS